MSIHSSISNLDIDSVPSFEESIAIYSPSLVRHISLDLQIIHNREILNRLTRILDPMESTSKEIDQTLSGGSSNVISECRDQNSYEHSQFQSMRTNETEQRKKGRKSLKRQHCEPKSISWHEQVVTTEESIKPPSQVKRRRYMRRNSATAAMIMAGCKSCSNSLLEE